MELREYALSILESPELGPKLSPPPELLTDDSPGPALRIERPQRSDSISFAPRNKRGKIPRISSLNEPRNRAATLHRFANHELMALEVMAFALLAFPDLPAPFRTGLVHILAEEQLHCRLYLERMAAFGMVLGDLPLNDHFWRVVPTLQTPTQYLAAMALTFESANLDFAADYIAAFRAVGDEETAQVLERIEADEIKHVRFGVTWMRKLKAPGQSDWDAWIENLTFHNTPDRARGPHFNRRARELAGMSEEFIDRVERWSPPSAAPLPTDGRGPT